MGRKLFEEIGGRSTLEKVHKIFYDKMFEHSWLKGFFEDVEQQVIEDQQTDFMAQIMGGPQAYSGKLPAPGHKHMFITNEMFELRHQMLKESIEEAGVSDDLKEQWLKLDSSFLKAIVKESASECEKRFPSDEILIVPKPSGLKKAS